MDGVLVIDKPVGPTSHDVVAIVRRTIGVRKVGHLGTLDPGATGVLPILIGAATKEAARLAGDTKVYEFELCLGAQTDTDDDAGRFLGEAQVPVDASERLREIIPGFLGQVLQRPPRFSAVKVDGRRAYDLARRGIPFELEPRPVRIDAIEILGMHLPRVALRLRCGAGTYVRSLCRDLGEALRCGGYASSIRRIASGAFSIDRAITLETLVAEPDLWRSALIPLKCLVNS